MPDPNQNTQQPANGTPAGEPASGAATPTDQSAAKPTAGEPAGGDVKTGAESSAAPDGVKAPATALEAAKAAMAQERGAKVDAAKKAEAATGEPTKPQADGKTDNDDDEVDDPNEDLLKTAQELEADKVNVSKRARRTIRKLTKQYADMHAALSPRAERFDAIQSFVQSSGMEPKEFSELLNVGALIKSDPFAARERIVGVLRQLDAAIGLAELPADLADKVREGALDEAMAREISVTRNRAGFLQRQRQQDTQRQQTEQQQRQAQQNAHACSMAATQFENQLKASDPDYRHMEPFVHGEIHRLIQTEGVPTTPEETVAQAKKAVETVRARIKGFMPARTTEIKPATGGTSGPTIAAPKTALEAAKAALAVGR